MSFYHFNNIYCGYQRLIEFITYNNYYWNNIYLDCKKFIKSCFICTQTINNNFRIPKLNALQA